MLRAAASPVVFFRQLHFLHNVPIRFNGLRSRAMAFVPGFEHDVFISYAHTNNPGGEESGRVTRLHALLAERLRELTDGQLNIWRDTGLARNELFDETLKRRIESSALFLAINSNRLSKIKILPTRD